MPSLREIAGTEPLAGPRDMKLARAIAMLKFGAALGLELSQYNLGSPARLSASALIAEMKAGTAIGLRESGRSYRTYRQSHL